MNLVPQGTRQRALWEPSDPVEGHALMGVVDAINRRHGRGAVRLASASPVTLGPCRTCHLRSDHRSPRYTTRWDELPAARA
jgi:DNA polymerase V